MISVLMPCYNAAHYVAITMNSVLNQTYADFEYLIKVDDETTDNTLEVIESFKDPRIRVIGGSAHGISNVQNLLISEAKGEFIAQIDNDDIMYPDRLQVQHDFLVNNPEIDIVGGGYVGFGLIDYSFVMPDQPVTLESMKDFNVVSGPCVTIRRASLLKLNLAAPDEPLRVYDSSFDGIQDYELWIRALVSGQKIYHLEKPAIRYRFHSNQATWTANTEPLTEKLKERIRLSL